MSKIDACIFDLDGVIVDTARYHYQAWNTIAKKLGFEFTWEENEQLKGVSRVDSLDIILELGGINITDREKQKFLVVKNNLYLDLIKNMNPEEILPGVEGFLNDLNKNNIKIGLGSASKNARPILERVHLVHLFDAIVDGNEVEKGKPDPEVFIKGAKLLDSDPKSTVVFEDSQSGITAANAGGFISIGIGEEEVLGEAQIVIPGFQDITPSELFNQLS